jgi:hypothetical protein
VNESQPDDPLILVEREALKRLQEDAAGEIPNHVLFKFYSDLNRARERADKELEETVPAEFNLLEEVATLPPRRARKLLREESERLLAELNLVDDAILALEKDS